MFIILRITSSGWNLQNKERDIMNAVQIKNGVSDTQMADILVNECGLPELVPAEFGGTAE